MKAFAGLTEAQQRAWEQISVGNDCGHNRRVLESLEKKGMIVRRTQVLPGRLPVHITRWDCDLGWHMRWCQWCSGQEPMETTK